MVPSVHVHRSIPLFPFIKYLPIITEDLEESSLCAVETILLDILPVLQYLRLIRLRRRRAALAVSYPEVCRDLLCCLSILQAEQPCHKVDHIAVSTAGETVKPLVQLHAWVPVLMKRTERHAVTVGLDPIALCRIPRRDLFLDCVKKIHAIVPFFSKTRTSLFAVLHPPAFDTLPVIDSGKITVVNVKPETLYNLAGELLVPVISASACQSAYQFLICKFRNSLH